MSDHTSKFEKHHTIESGGLLLIDCLKNLCPEYSKQSLKRILQHGAVWLTRGSYVQRVRRGKRVLSAGDQVHIYYDEKVLSSTIQAPTLIADESCYSVWSKPKGMFSQGTRWGDANSICRWVESNAFSDRSAYQVHRLDRATSGLMLVAHSKKVAAQLSALFERRLVEKHYTAIVTGRFPQLERIDCDIDAKKAITLILKAEFKESRDQTELLLKIETGRKHQIRRHLAGLGFPIVGDRLYGNHDKLSPNEPDLQLESCYLSFSSPQTNEKKVYQL